MIWQRLIKKALDPFGVSHAQFVIMATLLWFRSHGYTSAQVDIINWTKLDPMTVSKSLKKLVLDGYVERVEHKSDARAKEVSLTKKGIKLVETLVPIVEAVDADFFASSTSARKLKEVL